jgi:hypothetical protein
MCIIEMFILFDSIEYIASEFFLLAIVFFVILRFMVSDYAFGIYKPFLNKFRSTCNAL